MGFTKLNNRYFNINFDSSKEKNYLGNMQGGDYVVKQLFDALKNKDLNKANVILDIMNKSKSIKKLINSQDKNGDTPLHLVIRNNDNSQEYVDLAKKIYKLGGKYGIPNKNNEYVEPTEEFKKFLEEDNLPKPLPQQLPLVSSLPSPAPSPVNQPSNLSISELTIEDTTPKSNNASVQQGGENSFINTPTSLTIESENLNSIPLNKNVSTLNENSLSIGELKVIQNGGSYSSSSDSIPHKRNVVLGRRVIVEDVDLEKVNGLIGAARAKATKKAKETKEKKEDKKEKKEKKEPTSSEMENADDLHKDALEKIEKIVKKIIPDVKKEDIQLEARVLKAILYKHIKETMPELNNLDRAKEMLKNVTEKMFEKLKDKIDSIGPEIRRHLQEKQSRRSESSLNMSTMSESSV